MLRNSTAGRTLGLRALTRKKFSIDFLSYPLAAEPKIYTITSVLDGRTIQHQA